jgi:hypothetical protein
MGTGISLAHMGGVQSVSRRAWIAVLAIALFTLACSGRNGSPPFESPGKTDSGESDAGADGTLDGAVDGPVAYDPAVEADGLCQKIQDIGCGGEGCRDALDGQIDEAREMSCTNALGAYYRCLRDHEITCADGPLQMPAECDSLLEAQVICVQLEGCQFDAIACEITCPDPWAAACTALGESWSCKCTDGPQIGDTFEIPAGQCRPVRLKAAAAEACE